MQVVVDCVPLLWSPTEQSAPIAVELCDDPVVEKLVVDIATGFAHVGPTIELCRLLKATGRGGGGVDLIASLGGANVQNVRRDLNNFYAINCITPH